MRKCISLVIVVCIILLGINAVSAASIVYEIDYWHSDSDAMGMWSTKSIDVYVGTNLEMPSLSIANLKNYLNTAKTSWACTGISYNYVSQQGSADLVLGGITRAEATNNAIPTSVLAWTTRSQPTKMATLYYGSVEKTLYKIDRAAVYLIESDEASVTSGARKLVVHEMGHALGYLGHYNYGTVMTEYFGDITSTTPSAAEKNHLGQVY